MFDDKLAQFVARVLIATFAFGNLACYPAFQAARPVLFAHVAAGMPDGTPDSDGGQPVPRSPLTEDISERPLSELIHPHYDGVLLQGLEPNALPPNEPSSLYSMHSSSELLRPPQA